MEIYYFTRTNKCKTLANDLSNQLNCSFNKINDNKDWMGKVNFVKAGAMAAKKEILPIEYKKVDNKEIIIIFPIWAGTLPPAVRTFLSENKTIDITAIVVSAISSLKDVDKKYFKKIYEVKGKDNNLPKELISK